MDFVACEIWCVEEFLAIHLEWGLFKRRKAEDKRFNGKNNQSKEMIKPDPAAVYIYGQMTYKNICFLYQSQAMYIR